MRHVVPRIHAVTDDLILAHLHANHFFGVIDQLVE